MARERYKPVRRFVHQAERQIDANFYSINHPFTNLPAHDAGTTTVVRDPFFMQADDSGNIGSSAMASSGVLLTTAATASGDDSYLRCYTTGTGSTVMNTAMDCSETAEFSLHWGFKTGSSIASVEIIAGAIPLGNVASAISSTNDVDQIGWTYNPANSPNWRLFIVSDGSQEFYDTGLAVAASTRYLLGFRRAASGGLVTFLYNNDKVRQLNTATRSVKDDGSTAVVYSPMISVETKEAVAKSITVSNVALMKQFV